jgi:alpha-galactosidase
MKPGDEPENVNADLVGIKRLGLLVAIADSGARRVYSDWANAQFEMLNNAVPKPIPNDDVKYILTPQPSKIPRINSAAVFGASPGNPFLYTIAATGERPIQFAVKNLPEGLSLDFVTGIITGTIIRRGTYVTTMEASNKLGRTAKQLIIKIGDTIALTPPIGWNGWNSWAKNIDREKVIASANAMVSSGLSNHGWTYVNVDDAWQGQRGGKYNAIQPNAKFSGFKKMIDYIHSKGLKFGVYSTPWISSYAGYPGGSSNFEDGAYPDSVRDNKRAYRYVGKYRFEKNDALQMADWGVDYLKYDWHIDLVSAERMSDALRHSGRDIFYSLSNSATFALAKDWESIANAWRTGPDIRDSWLSLYVSAFSIDKWAPYAGAGHWNDPDMLIVGNISTGSVLHPTRLTPDEQYSHVSIFSLLAAPLIIGCPIEQMDAFTLNLLSNDEVIDVDQDPLGKPARLLLNENDMQVWVKPMQDGSYAVGLFNIDGFGKTPQSYFHWGDEKSKSFEFDFDKVGLRGKWKLRDVWRQKNLGVFYGSFTTSIRHHGVVLLRMFPVK